MLKGSIPSAYFIRLVAHVEASRLVPVGRIRLMPKAPRLLLRAPMIAGISLTVDLRKIIKQ